MCYNFHAVNYPNALDISLKRIQKAWAFFSNCFSKGTEVLQFWHTSVHTLVAKQLTLKMKYNTYMKKWVRWQNTLWYEKYVFLNCFKVKKKLNKKLMLNIQYVTSVYVKIF